MGRAQNVIVPPRLRAIPSAHREAIEAAFGPTRPGADAVAGPDLVIGFTNRSGSNYLAQLLASTGVFNEAGEFFNAETVLHHARARGLTSLPDYARALPRLVPAHRFLAAKAAADQLALLADAALLTAKTVFVLIERRDVLAQAVSRALAAATGRWSVHHEARLPAADVPFDAEAVRTEMAKIEAGNAALRLFLAANGVRPVHLLYEELCHDPNAAMEEIGARFGIALRADPERVTLKRQSDATNERWQHRFAQETRAAVLTRTR